MVVAKKGAHVDGVANATKGQGGADAQLVGEGAGEEADDGEGRVESGVGVVVCGRVQLAAAAHSVDGIEHARAHEAHEGDDEQLDRGRGIPREPAEDLLVLPRVRQLENALRLRDGGVWGGDVVGDVLLVEVGHCVGKPRGRRKARRARAIACAERWSEGKQEWVGAGILSWQQGSMSPSSTPSLRAR